MSRNKNRKTKSISKSQYSELLKSRDAATAEIFTDPFIGYPPQDERRKMTYEEHYWSVGDNYFKLATKYYGDRKDWWVIARFNGKPTNADVAIGDRLVIPFPLDIAKDYMGYFNDY